MYTTSWPCKTIPLIQCLSVYSVWDFMYHDYIWNCTGYIHIDKVIGRYVSRVAIDNCYIKCHSFLNGTTVLVASLMRVTFTYSISGISWILVDISRKELQSILRRFIEYQSKVPFIEESKRSLNMSTCNSVVFNFFFFLFRRSSGL